MELDVGNVIAERLTLMGLEVFLHLCLQEDDPLQMACDGLCLGITGKTGRQGVEVEHGGDDDIALIDGVQHVVADVGTLAHTALRMLDFEALDWIVKSALLKVRAENGVNERLLGLAFDDEYKSFHSFVGCPLMMLIVHKSPSE